MKKEETVNEENKEKKEKKLKLKIKIKDPFLVGLIVLILIGIIIFTYNATFKITNIAEFSNNEYTIYFKQIGEPMLMGENKIKTELKKDGEIVEELTFSIYNKGNALNEESITVNWLEEFVEVKIKGEGIKEDTHNVYYEKGIEDV